MEISLAIWGIPSSIVAGDAFRMKVGATSSARAELAHTAFDVCDDRGVQVACGQLGEAEWPGAPGLYWAEVEVTAPADVGVFGWSVRLADIQADESHGCSAFSVATIRRPGHRVTVKLQEQDTQTSIANAEVRLRAHLIESGLCAAVTDECGTAYVDVPGGLYDLVIWKAQYEAPATMVDVHDDITCKIELKAAPKTPRDRWM